MPFLKWSRLASSCFAGLWSAVAASLAPSTADSKTEFSFDATIRWPLLCESLLYVPNGVKFRNGLNDKLLNFEASSPAIRIPAAISSCL